MARVLQAAGVVEALAEDEWVGVLTPGAVVVVDEERLVEEVRTVRDAVGVPGDDPRFRLPLAPEDDLSFLDLAAIDVATSALQKLAPVCVAVPELEVALIGPVLAAGVDELHEAAALTH